MLVEDNYTNQEYYAYQAVIVAFEDGSAGGTVLAFAGLAFVALAVVVDIG